MHVVVLGGGSSGEHFVGALRRLDAQARITVVERRLVGGECSYWACMPTKTMLRATELQAAAGRAAGVFDPGPLDVQAVFRWRDRVAERDDAAQVEWLDGQRAELVRGDAVVSRAGLVSVDGVDLAYDRLVIATGSSPAIPAISGIEQVDYWTNIEATETLAVPQRLLVLGGGPVGCELAQFFARIGSSVTLVQSAERLLPRVDSDAAALVTDALTADGVDIRLDSRAEAFDSPNSLTLADGTTIDFDRLLLATGRRPNIAGLDALALTTGPSGIEVDSQLQAAPNVWAIGDVNGIAAFTHVGKYHARVAAANIVGRAMQADHRAVPATIFTDPQVATVGATTGGVSARWELGSVPRLATYERPKSSGFVKVTADPDRRILTGAVGVGPEAGEWLQQLTLAIRAEIPIDVLLDTIQPYPTFSEGIFLALRELGLDL